MCTVAFIPARGGGYLLGHNRDEARSRSRARPPRRTRRGGLLFVAPRDPDGGGTWIGINEAGLAFCILNGSDANPGRLPEKPRSRGLVAWDLLHLGSAGEAARALRDFRPLLDEVRAFQLVIAEPGLGGDAASISRFAWDGAELKSARSPGPALFVSSGYDQQGAERARGELWRDFLTEAGAPNRGPEPGPDPGALAAFLAGHLPRKGELSVCMHRERARSVSRSVVVAQKTAVCLIYHDGPPCHADAPEFTRILARRPAAIEGAEPA